MNKTLKQILTMYVDGSFANWDTYLQAAISAYNSTIHSSIGCSPYEVLFARKPRVVADVILSTPIDFHGKSIDDYLSGLRQASSKIQEQVSCSLAKSRATQKKQYDKFINAKRQFEVGDLVLLTNDRHKVGDSKSFRERAIGPFKIIEIFNDVNYKIQCVGSSKVQTIHYNRLRCYNERDGTQFGTGLSALSNGPCKPVTTSLPSDTNGDLTSCIGNLELFRLVISANLRRRVADTSVISDTGSNEDGTVGLTGDSEENNGSKSAESSGVNETIVAANPLVSQAPEQATHVLDHVYNGEAIEGGAEGENEVEGGKEKCPVCGLIFIRLKTHCNAKHKEYYNSRWGGEGM
jgi:hypothetical protein